jgi:hypothetical protein
MLDTFAGQAMSQNLDKDAKMAELSSDAFYYSDLKVLMLISGL